MEKPAIIHDSEFVELIYDSDLDWYTATVPSKWGHVNVSLDCDDEYSSHEELLNDLRLFCSSLETSLDLAFSEISKKMVSLKNDCWLNDGEAPVTEEYLLQVVQSQDVSISLSRGGLAEIFFSDGGLFGGHSIVVWHYEDGTVGDAHLAG